MRDDLAQQLLASVMGWKEEKVAEECVCLQTLAELKYDEYGQFSPGGRFIESLACWLSQFTSKEERDLAYNFIKDKLIFVSSLEMAHLVSTAFIDHIRPILVERTAGYLGISKTRVVKVVNSERYKLVLRQSLFVGLSDGAHLDLFRRSNPVIGNEQVSLTYDISDTKVRDMLNKLFSSVKSWLGKDLTASDGKFHSLFLLDDFLGSGLSYIRKSDNGGWDGKIVRLYQKIYEGDAKDLLDLDDITVCLLLYIATARGLESVRSKLDEFCTSAGYEKPIIKPIQEIPESESINSATHGDVVALLKKYWDDSIVTEHYRVGRCDEPYLGFDQCALPLVLAHNTPNNSIPLLWYDGTEKYRGLFARQNRHRRES